MSDDHLAKQGIDAYLDGDEENARRLLLEAVDQNPNNADAWYYLSRIYSNPERIRYCLTRAIQANPDHERAKRALRELDPIMVDDDPFADISKGKTKSGDPAQDAAQGAAQDAAPDVSGDDSRGTPRNRVEFPQSPFTRSTPQSKAGGTGGTPSGESASKPAGTPSGTPSGKSSGSRPNPFENRRPNFGGSSSKPPTSKWSSGRGGSGSPQRPSTMSYKYRMPSGIPGAPERLSAEEYFSFLKDSFQTGFSALATQNLRIDTIKASWWHIWLLVFSVGFISGIITLILLMFVNARALNVLNIVSVPLLITLRTLIGFGAAAYFTHWYMTTQAKLSSTFLDHSFTLVMLWAPASLVNLGLFIVAFVLNAGIITFPVFMGGGLLNAGFLTLVMTAVAAALAGWTMYRIWQSLMKLYGFSADPRPFWIAAASVLVILSLVI